MSRKSLDARKLAAAGVLAAATLGAAGTAQAADTTLNYSCAYPLIGTQPLSVAINASIPSRWNAGEKTPAFAIKAVANPGGDTANGLSLVLAKSLEGSAVANALLQAPGYGASGLKLKVPISLEKYNVPASGALSLNATGATPALQFNTAGPAVITLGDLALNLTARRADGSAIVLPPVGTDSDGNPETFDVNCTIAPSSQSPLLSILPIFDGTEAPDGSAPSVPGGVSATATSSSAISLSWSASTDNVGVQNYEVYQDGVLVQNVQGTSTTIAGLAANTRYGFTIKARDAAGNVSAASGRSSAVTNPSTATGTLVPYNFTMKGTANLRTITSGSIPLLGAIGARINLATQAFDADLKLNNTRANLTLAGFVPVTANIGFQNAGPTTGTLKDGKLVARTVQTIRLPQLYLFGSVPVAGSGGCRTKAPSTILLRSTQPQFDPLKGGPIQGGFVIGELVDCGALTGIISPLAQGSGNTINVNLTPAN